MRARNQRDVFEAVHRNGPIARAEIANQLGLSPAAVTNITGELISRGLLFEVRAAEAEGVGRKAILLGVNYGAKRVAGVKVSQTSITCAVTHLNAEVLATSTHDLTDTAPGTVVAAISRGLAELGATDVAALGVDLPGAVADDGKTVRYSPLLGWEQVPIGAMLTQHLGLPVIVENDVNALALAEGWFAYGRGHPDFLTVTLGRGVGLGIVVGGEIYRGPRGGAGEFGHVVLDPMGPATEHARRGSIEAYLSDDGIVRSARHEGITADEASTASDLTLLARNGDARAIAVFEAAGDHLGRALALLVNIFAPTLIVLSGEGMRAADFLLPTARAAVLDYSFGDLGRATELVVDTWGDDAWARGAAGLAASRYLLDEASRTGGEQQLG